MVLIANADGKIKAADEKAIVVKNVAVIHDQSSEGLAIGPWLSF